MTKLQFLELVTETIGDNVLNTRQDCLNIVTQVSAEYEQYDVVATSTASAMGLTSNDVLVWKAYDDDNVLHIMLFVHGTESFVYYGELQEVPVNKYFGMMVKIRAGLYNMSDVAVVSKIMDVCQSLITAVISAEQLSYEITSIIASEVLSALKGIMKSIAQNAIFDNVTTFINAIDNANDLEQLNEVLYEYKGFIIWTSPTTYEMPNMTMLQINVLAALANSNGPLSTMQLLGLDNVASAWKSLVSNLDPLIVENRFFAPDDEHIRLSDGTVTSDGYWLMVKRTITFENSDVRDYLDGIWQQLETPRLCDAFDILKNHSTNVWFKNWEDTYKNKRYSDFTDNTIYKNVYDNTWLQNTEETNNLNVRFSLLRKPFTNYNYSEGYMHHGPFYIFNGSLKPDSEFEDLATDTYTAAMLASIYHRYPKQWSQLKPGSSYTAFYPLSAESLNHLPTNGTSYSGFGYYAVSASMYVNIAKRYLNDDNLSQVYSKIPFVITAEWKSTDITPGSFPIPFFNETGRIFRDTEFYTYGGDTWFKREPGVNDIYGRNNYSHRHIMINIPFTQSVANTIVTRMFEKTIDSNNYSTTAINNQVSILEVLSDANPFVLTTSLPTITIKGSPQKGNTVFTYYVNTNNNVNTWVVTWHDQDDDVLTTITDGDVIVDFPTPPIGYVWEIPDGPIHGDVDIYLKGVPTYTVTFDTSGGSPVPSQLVFEGEKATEPTTIRNGYTFDGWHLNGVLFNFNTPITDDITLVARWTKIETVTHTVTFKPQGGSSCPVQVVEEGNTAYEPTTTRTGYRFLGWFTSSDVRFNFNTPITNDITLYAHWSQIDPDNPDPTPDPEDIDHGDPIIIEYPDPDPPDIPLPIPPTIDVPIIIPDPTFRLIAGGGVYVMSNPDPVFSWLWSTNVINMIKQNVLGSPLDAILGFLYIPYPIDNMSSYFRTENIQAGFLTSEISSQRLIDGRGQFIDIDLGTTSLYTSYYDYRLQGGNAACKLYIPYIGYVDISVNDVMNSTIHLKGRIDILTGSLYVGVYIDKLSIDNPAQKDMLPDYPAYVFSGNCAYQLPISAGSLNSIIGSLASIATGAVGGFAVGGGPVGAAIGAGAGAIGAAMQQNHTTSSKGGFNANSGLVSPQQAFMVLEYGHPVLVGGQQEVMGYPCFARYELNQLSGYVKILDIDYVGMSCTSDELEEIDELLKEGVYI